MEVIFYSEFSKRRNSTKNPTSPGAISVSVTKEVRLKGNCDILRPSFFVSGATGFVYCKAWNCYYHIKKIAYDINDAEYIECEIDVLGTWREAIKEMNAFVKYSSSDYNVFLTDSRIVPTAKLSSKSISLDFSDTIGTDPTDDFEYCYLFTCYTNTGLKTYVLNRYGVIAVITQLMIGSKDFFGSIEQYFSDARDAIVSLRITPFKKGQYGLQTNGVPENIFIGNFDTAVLAEYLTSYMVLRNDGLPLTGEINRSDFRIREPYTYAKLFLPLIGLTDFSLEEIQDGGALFFSMYANVLSGKVMYYVYSGNGNISDDRAKIVGVYEGSAGVELPLATSMLENPMASLVSTTKAAGGLAAAGLGLYAAGGTIATLGTGIAVAGGLATAISGEAQTFMHLLKENISISGAFSGNFGWNACKKIKLEVFTPDVSESPDDLLALYGRPLLQVKKIGDLSGYVETKGFSIDVNAIDEVKDMINQAMDSGVYLE